MKFPILVACLLTGSAYAQVQVVAPPVNLKPGKPGKASAVKPTVSPSTYRNARLQPFGGSLALNGSDSCATPDAIAGNGPFSFDTTAATTGLEGQAETLCNAYNNPPIGSDVWFVWTSNINGPAVLSLCAGAGFDTKVAVYAGNACPVNGSALACNDDFCGVQSQLTFTATIGNQYMIQLGGYVYAGGPQTGTGTYTIQAPPPPPANDDCSTATVIAGSGPFPYDNVAATTGAQGQAEGICTFFGSTAIPKDIWYTWTAGFTGTAQVSFCGNTTDTKIAVYAGAGCPAAGTAIACNDDHCGLQSLANFACTNGSQYTIQMGLYAFATVGGTGTFTINQFFPPTNDECTGAIPLVGAGPYAFDNSNATTGVTGQSEALCNFYATTVIDNDIWYTWTAGASGLASLALCGGSFMDSKVAVYAGSGCPTAGTAIACNDDSCGLQSALCFNVTNGSTYMIQLGNYPGALGAAGTFTITVGAAAPPCDPSDGSTENLLGWTVGGEMVWLNKFGGIGQSNTISTVDIAWGSLAFPGFNPGNGTNATIAVWKDANDDGDPSDGILLAQMTVVVANVDTDMYNTFTLPSPLTISGVFHVGAAQIHVAGQFVATMDTNSCGVQPSGAWFFGDNTGGPVNYANPGANVQPPMQFSITGFPAVCLIRTNCNAGPMSAYCDPAVGGVIGCPCANPPSGIGRGCENSSATGGASISGTGTASLGADTLVFTTSNEKPTATSIVLQGNASLAGGVIFGQGVRCVGGTLKRIGVKAAVAGSITYPQGGDLSVSAKSAFLGDPIAAGTDRFYMVYYRDPVLLGGCMLPNTFNGTNGGKVTWAP